MYIYYTYPHTHVAAAGDPGEGGREGDGLPAAPGRVDADAPPRLGGHRPADLPAGNRGAGAAQEPGREREQY